ncbi:hypothetical protein M3231_06140 [Neobacillus mesonae]|nr:hypothetical protein [Neobacillus mesonae]
MSDKAWKVSIIVVACIVIAGIVMSELQKWNSFKQLVLEPLGETKISKLVFIENSDFVVSGDLNLKEITDQATIHEIMSAFENIRLKKNVNPWNHTLYEDGYRMMIHPERGPYFTVMFNDKGEVRIDNNISHHKKYSWTYDVTNSFDFSFTENLF